MELRLRRAAVGALVLAFSILSAWHGVAAAAIATDPQGQSVSEIEQSALPPTPPPVPTPSMPDPPTPHAKGSCDTNHQLCASFLLRLLNNERQHHGLPRLKLVDQQSRGSGACVGSYGHSKAMARTSSIWHINPSFPKASFPNNICLHHLTTAGQNVGASETGSVSNDLRLLHEAMMREPHKASDCSSLVNHACNVLNPHYHEVGIGLYYFKGVTWMTEDFIG